MSTKHTKTKFLFLTTETYRGEGAAPTARLYHLPSLLATSGAAASLPLRPLQHGQDFAFRLFELPVPFGKPGGDAGV